MSISVCVRSRRSRSRMGWIALFVQLAVPLIVYGTATFGPWIQQSPSSANPFPSRAYLTGGVYAEGRYWVVGSGVCQFHDR